MPERDAKGWYDLETGLRYDPSVQYGDSKPRFKANNETIEARNIAKSFGGKALKGTAAQKKWAEQIRADILKSVTAEQAEILCFLNIFEHAKFWIENRSMCAAEIGHNAEVAAKLIKQINKLLRQAEAAIVIDSKGFITDKSKYNVVMQQREQVINHFNSLFKLN
jgi:hypothetical protein